MKKYFLLVTCLIFSGCGREPENQRELLAKLDAIKTDVAAKQPAAPRWAFANKREIESTIFELSRNKMERIKNAEKLSPETEAKISQYEHLQSQLSQARFAQNRPRYFPPPAGLETPTVTNLDELSKQVEAARAPIADIVERRSRQSAQYDKEFKVDQLVAEYAKDRFDLIVDASDAQFSRSPILYRKADEVVDITDGVIKLLKQKTQP